MVSGCEVYCANLHHGGAVVGAASFVDELPRVLGEGLWSTLSGLTVTASPSVFANLQRVDELRSLGVSVVVRHDLPGIPLPLRTRMHLIRVVLSGPEYRGRTAVHEVIGFNDANILPQAGAEGPPEARRLIVKRAIQRRILHRYDGYFTQTSRMARELESAAPGKPVLVAPNSPANIFRIPQLWAQSNLREPDADSVRLFYPARGYPHKNHSILPRVAAAFARISGRELNFVTTLRDDEMVSSGLLGCLCIENVGEVGLNRLPALYRDTDGVFFPSLNETSSVTPLEGMIMRRPVFASDRPFVRDSCGPHVEYIDPQDADATAQLISDRMLGDRDRSVDAAYDYVVGLPSQADRARSLASFVERFV